MCCEVKGATEQMVSNEKNKVFAMMMSGSKYEDVKKQVEKQTNMLIELEDSQVYSIIRQIIKDSKCSITLPTYKTKHQKKVLERKLIIIYLLEYEAEFWTLSEIAEISGLQSVNKDNIYKLIEEYENEGLEIEDSLVNLPFLRDMIGELDWSDDKLIKVFDIDEGTLNIFRNWYEFNNMKYSDERKVLFSLFSRPNAELYVEVSEMLQEGTTKEKIFDHFQDTISEEYLGQVIRQVSSINHAINSF